MRLSWLAIWSRMLNCCPGDREQLVQCEEGHLSHRQISSQVYNKILLSE